VKNFKDQVVAGSLYTFDLELAPAETATKETCPNQGEGKTETCHMEVWEKVWEDFREVQWDSVNCTKKGEVRKARQANLGAPEKAEVNQEIVNFALAQLAAGDVCRSKIVKVKNFKDQVVAGSLYTFDLELAPAETATKETCPNQGEGKTETCHMEVWEKVWEDFKEVQWDSVNCTKKGEVRKVRQALIGAPEQATGVLSGEQQAIVDFAFAQLAGGGTKCKSKIVKVENFQQQVVAGTRYTFDLVLGLVNSPDCPASAAAGDKTETCRMVVWEKVWENYKEVQWDEVDCPSAKNKTVKPSED